MVHVMLSFAHVYFWVSSSILKHQIPAVCALDMTLGGVLYSAIPFNGWYADTEVLRGEKRVYCKAQYIVQRPKTDTQRLLSLVPCLVVICAVSVYYILCRLN